MTNSSANVVQTLLKNPVDLKHVQSVTTPDVTYVSLSESNPNLKAYLPWTGINKGPESIVKVFEGIYKTWETKAFEVREIVEQGDNVVFLGSFTYQSRETGRVAISLFSLFAKIANGKISYIQFLEDTFATSGTINRQ